MPERGFFQRLYDLFIAKPPVVRGPSPAPDPVRPRVVVGNDARTSAHRSPQRSVQSVGPAHGPFAAPAVSAPARPQPDALVAFIATVRQLPLFSATAMQLMRSVGDESTQAGELVRLISQDAGLVAHLLRIVNSPYYGLPSRVSTIADAVAVMGFDQVRRTVSGAVLKRPLMSYLHDTEAVRVFWRHELLCASIARQLAAARGVDGEVAYMAGLMHEIGRLAMLIANPQLGDLLLRVSDDHDDLGIDREIAHFGFDHAAAGGALLERWGLPPPIVAAAYDHGGPALPANPVSAVVWQANLVAHHWAELAPDADDLPWIVGLGLTTGTRQRLMAEIAAMEADQS